MAQLPTPTAELQRPDGARLALYVDGPSDPDLVLVMAHGWQAAASVFNEHVRQLPRPRTRIVRYDQRGHGNSTNGRALPSIPLLADDLKAVIAATAPGPLPVLLAGHSMGGMTVLALAAQHPHLIGDKVTAALLAATTAGGLDLATAPHPPLKRLIGMTRHAMAAVCIHAPGPAHRIRDLVRPRPYQQPPIDHAARWFKALMRHDVADQLDALARIPVHILVGENDQTIPPIHALRLAAQIDTARLHVIPGGGHRLPTQHPEAFLTVLERACAEALPAGGRWHRRLARRDRATIPLPTSRGRTAHSRAS
ncbi:alpha/beta hydrolase [Streptomyces sp. RM72]|uniref:alpha/beta fold hydrolase n=1 Tax=Streptomyces sp. RM72 TaxID=1115510 RepID=UPI001B37126B|nr:alpha/beta hydrolase [Streptomyces sp. RM72]MBQ0888647.1 alpha/beta hydrolase [Streptomyces sp. RM72]